MLDPYHASKLRSQSLRPPGVITNDFPEAENGTERIRPSYYGLAEPTKIQHFSSIAERAISTACRRLGFSVKSSRTVLRIDVMLRNADIFSRNWRQQRGCVADEIEINNPPMLRNVEVTGYRCCRSLVEACGPMLLLTGAEGSSSELEC
jgi:hypothetical protein